jgi:hypothetical protein
VEILSKKSPEKGEELKNEKRIMLEMIITGRWRIHEHTSHVTITQTMIKI